MSRCIQFAAIGLMGALSTAAVAQTPSRPATFCNPVDLPYRFMPKPPVMRMAADPCVVLYKNE